MFMLTSSFVVRIWVGIQKKQKVIHLFSCFFFLSYEVSIKRVGWSQSFYGVVTTYNRQMRQMPHAEFAPPPKKKKIKKIKKLKKPKISQTKLCTSVYLFNKMIKMKCGDNE